MVAWNQEVTIGGTSLWDVRGDPGPESFLLLLHVDHTRIYEAGSKVPSNYCIKR